MTPHELGILIKQAEELEAELTPKEMLQAGIFGGGYYRRDPEAYAELPEDWKGGISEQVEEPDAQKNKYKVLAGQPYDVWKEKGWINEQDPLGWFQWYTRYHQGRRIDDDERQIKRHRQFRRFKAALEKRLREGKDSAKIRQALLQWAYDPEKIDADGKKV